MNLNNENKPNYYAIIPANVRYDNSLKAIEKLMYGEITALTNKEGYCFAKNGYFAELFEVANNTVSRWISNLEKNGYIKVDIIRDKRGQIIERRIFIVNTYLQNCRYPYIQNSIYPIYKRVEDNNINIKIDKLFNYIINNKGEILKDFPEKQLSRFKDLLCKLEFNYTKEQINIITEENQVKLKYIIYCLKDLVLSSRKALIHKLTREKLIYIYDNCKNIQKKNLGLESEIKNFYEYFYISVIKDLEKGM